MAIKMSIWPYPSFVPASTFEEPPLVHEIGDREERRRATLERHWAACRFPRETVMGVSGEDASQQPNALP